MSLEMYSTMPEDLSRMVEVVDGMIVLCESHTPDHQAIAQSLANALGTAARGHDAARASCHRVRMELDVLLTEVPFHFRRPDVVVYRCLPDDRTGRWRRKPFASDVLIAVEIVSDHTVSADTDEKRVVYAKAGIPNYWIVRMADDDGPAISIERLRLRADGRYVSEYVSFRSADSLALAIIDPFEMKMTWEQLDEWL
ncbi:Uma2 family endonuclease [Nocardia amamiensis]|uniref:Uma2 family endonuclease n=1 Tax=Nocardia amamiensis TaxID=404578 RepID=UPI001471EA35|nr:Uma2 family endonuclease [Nocardia amamiensis]